MPTGAAPPVTKIRQQFRQHGRARTITRVKTPNAETLENKQY